jgi:hypothetical protein
MPGPVVVSGASAMCTFGLAPGTLVGLPVRRVNVENRPVLTVADTIFPTNITGFSMCTSMANPAVAAATTAASGVLTPQTCTPIIAGTWQPGAPRSSAGGPALLTAGSICNCSFGGVISIVNPGSTRTTAS